MEAEGIIFNIQRFSLHDGPGIRTTVFLKGCPMRCLWCHNPESLLPKPQLSLTAVRCISCGRCQEVCPNGVHRPGKLPDFSTCIACGACAAACPSGALELLGRKARVDDVLQEVLQDLAFYARSGGGMTVSGGEPGMQPEFTTALLRAAKEKGIHTAIETAGWVSQAVYEKMLPWLDLILFDIKQMDAQKHLEYTQRDNTRIHKNLQNLCRIDCTVKVTVRTPVIPGYTDDPESFQKLAQFLHTLDRVPDVNVLPYNPLAGSKHPRLGMEYTLDGIQEANGISPDALCQILTDNGITAKVLR